MGVPSSRRRIEWKSHLIPAAANGCLREPEKIGILSGRHTTDCGDETHKNHHRRNEMDLNAINFEEKFTKFTAHWSPKIIAQMNDYHFKLAKIQGEFVWHTHDETDEVFIVIDGEMRIAFSDGSVHLKKGEMFVVPKGVEHKPIAADECSIMVIEPAGTVNTGDAGGDMTVAEVPWI
jgi:mannose-6-phosphate isomerase-like protein (cupin superfamily)